MTFRLKKNRNAADCTRFAQDKAARLTRVAAGRLNARGRVTLARRPSDSLRSVELERTVESLSTGCRFDTERDRKQIAAAAIDVKRFGYASLCAIAEHKAALELFRQRFDLAGTAVEHDS